MLGEYGFNEYLGLELEYLDGGTIEDSGLEIDTSGFVASVMGTYPVTGQFGVFAKIGMLFWDVDATIPGEGSGSESGEDFAGGIGAGYDFTENLGARLEYQGFALEEDVDGDLISAAVVWKF